MVVLVILGALGVLVMGMVGAAVLVGAAAMAERGPGDDTLTEVTVSGEGPTKIAKITISGVILQRMRLPLYRGTADVETVIEQLQRARFDDQVKGVLLYVDSPGGGVTASDRIHRAVSKTKAEKKVVALMGDRAASGGYYVSVAADRIFAHPTTTTGSIGVMMSSLNVHDLCKQHGVQMVVVKSTEHKDLLSAFKPLEELTYDKAVLQKVITSLYDRFTHLVSEGRGIPLERVRELADGRVYDAETALKNKLVDEIGYEEDAVDWMKKKLGKKQVKVIEYTRPLNLFARLLAGASLPAQQPLGLQTLPEALPWWPLRSRPAYLWVPGL